MRALARIWAVVRERALAIEEWFLGPADPRAYAAVRIGYAFAHDELIRNLMKVKLPFEPSSPSQAAAIHRPTRSANAAGSSRANTR